MPPKTKKEASKKQVQEKTKKVVEVGDRKTCVAFVLVDHCESGVQLARNT